MPVDPEAKVRITCCSACSRRTQVWYPARLCVKCLYRALHWLNSSETEGADSE